MDADSRDHIQDVFTYANVKFIVTYKKIIGTNSPEVDGI